MKVLVDMNLSPKWATFLHEQRIESIHWSAVGSGDAPDELMRWAAERDYIVSDRRLGFWCNLGRRPRFETKRSPGAE